VQTQFSSQIRDVTSNSDSILAQRRLQIENGTNDGVQNFLDDGRKPLCWVGQPYKAPQATLQPLWRFGHFWVVLMLNALVELSASVFFDKLFHCYKKRFELTEAFADKHHPSFRP
jgi:hypothetical protein